MNITSVSPRELMRILSGDADRYGPLSEEDGGGEAYDMSSIDALFRSAGYYRITGDPNRPDDVQLAEHAGGIARRLDTAFACGRFSGEEYRELCASLDEYIGERIRLAETEKAFSRLRSDRSTDEYSPAGKGFADIFNDRRKKAEEYLADGLDTDRQALMNMINLIRNGRFF